MFLKEWLFHISTFLSSPDPSGATSHVEQNPHGAIICLWLAAKCSKTPSFASRAPPPPPFYAPPWDHNKVTLNTAQSLQELEGGGGVGEGGATNPYLVILIVNEKHTSRNRICLEHIHIIMNKCANTVYNPLSV